LGRGHYNPADRQRIFLNATTCHAPQRRPLGRGRVAANTSVFYVVKSAMEYSKSLSTRRGRGSDPGNLSTAEQHPPLIPLALIAAVVGHSAGRGWVIGRLLT